MEEDAARRRFLPDLRGEAPAQPESARWARTLGRTPLSRSGHVGKHADRLPKPLRIADDPGLGDHPARYPKQSAPRVAHTPPGRRHAEKVAAMRPAPGQARDDAGVRGEQLVDPVVPIGKRPANAFHVIAKGPPSDDDGAERAPKANLLDEQLVDELEPPLVPELVVEAANHGLAEGHPSIAGRTRSATSSICRRSSPRGQSSTHSQPA